MLLSLEKAVEKRFYTKNKYIRLPNQDVTHRKRPKQLYSCVKAFWLSQKNLKFSEVEE